MSHCLGQQSGIEEWNTFANLYECTHLKPGGAGAQVFCFNAHWTEKERRKITRKMCVSGTQELSGGGGFRGCPEQAEGRKHAAIL